MPHRCLDDDLLVVPRIGLGFGDGGLIWVDNRFPVFNRLIQILQINLHHIGCLPLQRLLGVLAIVLGGGDPHALGEADGLPLALGVLYRVMERSAALADERIHRRLANHRILRIEFALDGGIAPVPQVGHQVNAQVHVAHLLVGGELAPQPHLVIVRRVERVHHHPPLNQFLKDGALGPLVLRLSLNQLQDFIYGHAHRS